MGQRQSSSPSSTSAGPSTKPFFSPSQYSNHPSIIRVNNDDIGKKYRMRPIYALKDDISLPMPLSPSSEKKKLQKSNSKEGNKGGNHKKEKDETMMIETIPSIPRLVITSPDPRLLPSFYPPQSFQLFSPALSTHIPHCIHSYLTITEIVTLSRVSGYVYHVFSMDSLWKMLLRRDFDAVRARREGKGKMDTKGQNPLLEVEEERKESENINVNENVSSLESKKDDSPSPSPIPTKSLLRSFFSSLSSSSPSPSSPSTSTLPFSGTSLTDVAEYHSFRHSLGYHDIPNYNWDLPPSPLKLLYHSESRRYYDPCLLSPHYLSQYFINNPVIVKGFTKMCEAPKEGTPLYHIVKKLKLTWPIDIVKSCEDNFGYLSHFYFIWSGQKILNLLIPKEQLATVDGVMGYSLSTDESTGQPILICNVDVSRMNEVGRVGVREMWRKILEMEWVRDLFGNGKYVKFHA